MIKPVLTYLSDLGLVVVLLVVMVAGIFGARLPYRQPAINTGPYQLEAFPVGLSWYQYGRVSPFYTLSPLNDYLVASGSGRLTLLSQATFDQKQFVSSLDQAKPYRLWETMKAYFGLTSPRYSVSTGEMSVSYVSSLSHGEIVMITRSIQLAQPRWIESQTMTLAYNVSDEVVVNEGMVTISNPTVAGSLVLVSSLNQKIVVNKEAQLIEITSPVNQMTNALVFVLKGKGKAEGEQ